MVLIWGCDDAAPSFDAGAEIHDDAGPIAETLLASGPLALKISPDGASATLWHEQTPLLIGLSPQISIAQQPMPAGGWSSLSWTVRDGEAEARFGASDGRPTLRWTLALTDTQLTARLQLEGVGPAVPITQVVPLRAERTAWQGREDRARPAASGPWVPVPATEPRPDVQWLDGPAGTARIHGAPTQISLTDGLHVYERSPTRSLGRGDQLTSAAVVFEYSPSGPPSRTPAPTEPGPVGWRSAAWHSAVNRQLVARQATALRAHALNADALLLLDGLWYAGPGDARAGLPFIGGLTPLAEFVAPSELAVAWPLHAAPDDPLVLDHPAAALDETPRCRAPACLRLDPRLPAVRPAVARARLDAPHAGRWVPDLPPPQHVGAPALAALRAELQDALGPMPLLSGPIYEMPWPADDPCQGAAQQHPWPADCAVHLVSADAQPPSAPTALETLAWALLDTAIAPRDPGPVRLDRPLNEARLAVALAWIAGGPRLLGDELSTLEATRWPLAEALFGASLGPAWPIDLPADTPPEQWRSAHARLITRWHDTPRTFTVPSEGAPWHDLLRPDEGPFAAESTITLPARDAAVLVSHTWFTGARAKE